MMKRILVIEGDAAVRELMGATLLKRGYQVTLSADILLGYDTALFVKPDLIVTDIQLSGREGINIIKQIRETASLRHVRILITTAFGTGTATFSLQHGADGYEPKPIDPRSFVMTVERLLAGSDGIKAA
jgi:DNA-binding response OmpR family regulator